MALLFQLALKETYTAISREAQREEAKKYLDTALIKKKTKEEMVKAIDGTVKIAKAKAAELGKKKSPQVEASIYRIEYYYERKALNERKKPDAYYGEVKKFAASLGYVKPEIGSRWIRLEGNEEAEKTIGKIEASDARKEELSPQLQQQFLLQDIKNLRGPLTQPVMQAIYSKFEVKTESPLSWLFSWSSAMTFFAGFLASVRDASDYRPDEIDRAFGWMGIGRQYTDSSISWLNKYEGHDPKKGLTFAGKYAVWTTDMRHLSEAGHTTFLLLALANLTYGTYLDIEKAHQECKTIPWYIIAGRVLVTAAVYSGARYLANRKFNLN